MNNMMNKVFLAALLVCVFATVFADTVCESCINACNISPKDATNCINRCRQNLSNCPGGNNSSDAFNLVASFASLVFAVGGAVLMI